MNRPLVWVGLALAGGTYAGAAGLCPGLALPLLLCGVGFGAASIARRPHLNLAGVVLAFAAAGALLWNLRQEGPPGDPLSRYAASHPEARYVIEGRVRSAQVVLPDTTYTRFLLDVDHVFIRGEAVPLRGGLVVRWTDPDRPVFVGERVRVEGPLSLALDRVNPGVQSSEDYLRRHGVHSGMRLRGPGAVVRLARARAWSPPYWASRFRTSLARRLSKVVPEEALPFVFAVWLGERNLISTEEYRAYVVSGTAHILAVSGVHMCIVFVSVAQLLRLATQRRRVRAAVTMVAVFLFAFTAGARTASIRAAVMIALYLIAELFDREPDAPTALSVAGILFVLRNPQTLFDIGFQLSFLSVASLLIYGDRIADALQALPVKLRKPAATPLAVQILPLPLAAHYFHVLPILGPLANLLVVPLLSAALWLSFLTSAAAFLSSDIALLFGHALYPVVWAIRCIAGFVAGARGAHAAVVSPTLVAMVCYWGAAAAMTVRAQRRAWKVLITFAVVLVAAMCALWRPWRQEPKVVFLDVGHGDAIFARTPGGDTVLVDGGDRNEYTDMGARVVAPFLWSDHVSRLNYVVLSHPDRDHIGGLPYILDHFAVEEVLLSCIETDRQAERDLLDQCGRLGIPVRRLARGDTVRLDGATLDVLHPPRTWPAAEDNANDLSLVMRLEWPGMSVLLTGDIERAAETVLAERDCEANVLKVPHHGSRTSSSRPFIRAASPQHAVVSTGGSWGREGISSRVMEAYLDFGIQLWRTDYAGGITATGGKEGKTMIEGTRMLRGYVTPALPRSSAGRRPAGAKGNDTGSSIVSSELTEGGVQ